MAVQAVRSRDRLAPGAMFGAGPTNRRFRQLLPRGLVTRAAPLDS